MKASSWSEPFGALFDVIEGFKLVLRELVEFEVELDDEVEWDDVDFSSSFSLTLVFPLLEESLPLDCCSKGVAA